MTATERHMCGECAIGSYDGQVELVPPPFLARSDGRGICVDACLALEVSRLWAAGIETTGCCCGHGKLPPYIGVVVTDIPRMKALGYEVAPNPIRPGDEDNFKPKTAFAALISSLVAEREQALQLVNYAEDISETIDARAERALARAITAERLLAEARAERDALVSLIQNNGSAWLIERARAYTASFVTYGIAGRATLSEGEP